METPVAKPRAPTQINLPAENLAKPEEPKLTLTQRIELLQALGYRKPKPSQKPEDAQMQTEEFQFGKRRDPEDSWGRVSLRLLRMIAICREHQVQAELQSMAYHRLMKVESESEDEYIQVKDSKSARLRGTVATRM
jgi:hypothetical protein